MSLAVHVGALAFVLLVGGFGFLIADDLFGPPVRNGVVADWNLQNRVAVGFATLVALTAAAFFVAWGHRIALNRLRTQLTVSVDIPLLIVRSPSDEAGVLLGAAQLTSWLMPYAIAAVTLVLVGSAVDEITSHYSGRDWTEILGFLMAVTFTWAILMLLSLVFIGLVAGLFGHDALFGVYSHRISTESTPTGSWTVHCIQPAATATSAMRHSVYEEPEVIRILAEWLESLAANAQQRT
jgi:hypothetical protein